VKAEVHSLAEAAVSYSILFPHQHITLCSRPPKY